MADATVTFSTGRTALALDLVGIKVTVTPSTTTYAAASGGLPIDLADILKLAAPFSQGQIRPDDIVGIMPLATSTAGYIPLGLTLGTATYTSGVLATCPAWVKLVGIGASASQYAALGQAAEGSNSDPFSFLLLVARGGANA